MGLKAYAAMGIVNTEEISGIWMILVSAGENIEEKDRCNGCFGAANNDCHICPKNGLEV